MSKKRLKKVTPKSFRCGFCGARPNSPCVVVTGRTKGKASAATHKSRISQYHLASNKGHPYADEMMPDGITRRDSKGHIPPQLPDTWRVAFLKTTLRTGFCLALTQPMLELLCAVATGFQWDRAVFRHSMGMAMPDNTIATVGALERRGLVRHRGTDVVRAEVQARSSNERSLRFIQHQCDTWELTPAGVAVVDLLKVTGVFIEPAAASDAAARKVVEGS